jgi:hypothetical protein
MWKVLERLGFHHGGHTREGSSITFDRSRVDALRPQFAPQETLEQESTLSPRTVTTITPIENDVTDVTDVTIRGERDMVSPEDLELLRDCLKEEMNRVGYAQDSILRYRAKDQSNGSIDDQRYAKLLRVLADNGEIQAFGANCWRLKL